MKTKLSVNVNAVAQLRNRRNLPWPSVLGVCRVALSAGSYGITVHPRPDERHIRRTDVLEIREMLRREYPGKEYNIEGFPTEDFLTLALSVKPDQVTLVPDEPGQNTSDHGWDIVKYEALLRDVVARLHAAGIRVSLVVDAEEDMAPRAKVVGADRVELYTGPYGGAFEPEAKAAELFALERAGKAAYAAGLAVNAGHDLTRENLPALISALPFLAEVSIGHAITADALLFGMAETVRLYRAACGDPVF